MDAAAQIPPVLHVITVAAPAQLPAVPDGYRYTRLGVLLDDHMPDLYLPADRLTSAAHAWVERGTQRAGLFALAVYDHPVLDLSEVYSEWSEQNAEWSGWRVLPGFGAPPAPTATEIEAHAADLAADQLAGRWTAAAILRREG